MLLSLLGNDIFLIIDVRSVFINDNKEKKNNNTNNNNNDNNNKEKNNNNNIDDNDLKSYWTILPLSIDSRDPEICLI